MISKLEDGACFICLVCHKIVVQKGNLKKHLSSMQQGDQSRECNVCGKQFKNINWWLMIKINIDPGLDRIVQLLLNFLWILENNQQFSVNKSKLVCIFVYLLILNQTLLRLKTCPSLRYLALRSGVPDGWMESGESPLETHKDILPRFLSPPGREKSRASPANLPCRCSSCLSTKVMDVKTWNNWYLPTHLLALRHLRVGLWATS